MTPQKFFQKIIELAFYLLFFLTPFIFTTNNYELFEFPKMLFVYAVTVIIVGAWLAKNLISEQLKINKNFLIWPLLFFLGSQIISTILSIDQHTSLWGYYSRFHGGLFSTICYTLLFLIFASSITKRQTRINFIALLSAATFISLYAIAEHFGIDAYYWVQDVQNRVFSTLGQPNWLAAWLVTLLPISWVYFLKTPRSFWPTAIALAQTTTLFAYGLTYIIVQKPLPTTGEAIFLFFLFFGLGLYFAYWAGRQLYQSYPKINNFSLLLIITILTLAILYTKSRSGILALTVSYGFFWLIAFLNSQKPQKLLKKFLCLSSLILFLFLLVGTEWTPSFQQLTTINKQQATPISPSQSTPKYHISKSTDIRKAVWEGGLNVFRHWPVFGSGVETFAYSYYNFRVRSHNGTSEWDFLYNKAHNEYLNFLATTGFVGTAALLSFTIAFFVFCLGEFIKKKTWVLLILALPFLFLLIPSLTEKLIIYPPLLFPLGFALSGALVIVFFLLILNRPKLPRLTLLQIGLLSGFISIIITNFYGFSVVTVGLLFFLYPAFAVTSFNKKSFYSFAVNKKSVSNWEQLNWQHWTGLAIISFVSIYFLINIFNYWRGDKIFNLGSKFTKAGDLTTGLELLTQATALRPHEALYHIELAEAASLTAFAYHSQDASAAAQIITKLKNLADQETKTALLLNSVHLNFYKTATKIYLTLAQIEPGYFTQAINVLEAAARLSPTDPKITLNLGNLYQEIDELEIAQAFFEKTVQLKPNYRQGWMVLGKFYQQQNQLEKAKKSFQYVLDNINSEDQEAKDYLEKLQ